MKTPYWAAILSMSLVVAPLGCDNQALPKNKEDITFNSLSPQEHLKKATEAFNEERYTDMDKHLSAMDQSLPEVKNLRKQYLDSINAKIAEQNKKDQAWANSPEHKKQLAKQKQDEAAKVKERKAHNRLLTPCIGMDAQTLYECSWGIPDRINRTQTALGTDEQWVYERHYKFVCVYLRGGVVYAIQD